SHAHRPPPLEGAASVTSDEPASTEIRPLAGPLDATLTLPGSKSLTNRALVIAALADGDSVLRGALDSDDTRHMATALARGGDVQPVRQLAASRRAVCAP